MRDKSGQAMIEFAICLLAFSLVLSALCAFGVIIPKTTELQNESRRAAGLAAQSSTSGSGTSLPPVISDNLPPDIRPLPAVELITAERDDTVELDKLSAEYFFDTNASNEFRIREKVAMPVMTIPGVEVNIQYGGEL